MESWKGHSKEEDFKIDPESGYFAAQKFANSPVDYLSQLRADLLDDDYSEEELGIQAIETVRELIHVMQNEKVPVVDDSVAELLESEDLSVEWGKSVFNLLKEAGYSKATVKTWLLLDEPFFTDDEEVNSGRLLNEYLDKVYDEN